MERYYFRYGGTDQVTVQLMLGASVTKHWHSMDVPQCRDTGGVSVTRVQVIVVSLLVMARSGQMSHVTVVKNWREDWCELHGTSTATVYQETVEETAAYKSWLLSCALFWSLPLIKVLHAEDMFIHIHICLRNITGILMYCVHFTGITTTWANRWGDRLSILYFCKGFHTFLLFHWIGFYISCFVFYDLIFHIWQTPAVGVYFCDIHDASD